VENREPKSETNWVRVRSECSRTKAFHRLRLEAEKDIQERNNLRPEGVRYKFDIEAESHAFIVYHESNIGTRAIHFNLNEDGISITFPNGTLICKATPTINEDGECCLKVNGKQMEFWQVRMLALEDLFFNVS